MPNQRRPKRAFKKRMNNNGLSRDVAYLKSVINAELHSLTNRYTALVVSNFGTIQHLSAISVGTGPDNRVGNSVAPKYCNVKLALANSSTNNLTCRLIFFIWKDQSSPAINQVLETADPWSHYNKEASGGLRDRTIMILKDKTFSFNSINESNNLVNIKLDLKMNRIGTKIPLHMKFNGVQVTSEMNGLYMLAIASSTNVLIDGAVKFSFYDN